MLMVERKNMKKIILLILAVGLLTACGVKDDRKIVDSPQEIAKGYTLEVPSDCRIETDGESYTVIRKDNDGEIADMVVSFLNEEEYQRYSEGEDNGRSLIGYYQINKLEDDRYLLVEAKNQEDIDWVKIEQ